MNIVAFVISLLAGLISFLQGGCATGIGAIGTGLGSRVGGYDGARIAREGASMGGAGLLVVLAALLAIIGGSFALPRKKASYWLLAISSGMCLLAVLVSGGMYKDAYVWLAAYAIAGGCAYVGCQDNQSEVNLTNNSSFEGMRSIFLSETRRPQENSVSTSSKTYEPIIGLETESLIKRAFLFLEDGEFDNAGQYLNQALNQDAEDSRVHFGLLMLECKVHNAVELVEKLSKPIEEEKLFQRALKFADDEYRKELENLAQAVRYKLEQKRLAEEAERERQRIEKERKRAEVEAENERRYQEILALREKATSVNELYELRRLVFNLRPYKDTAQIYNEVNKAYRLEEKYQDVKRDLQNASGINDLKKVIASLEELDDYKDSEKLLDEAQSKLEELEERARQHKKVIATACVIVALAVVSLLSWKLHKEKEAKTARQNAMIAFFEGRYDEANDAITAIISSDDEPATHAALLYVQTLMNGGTTQTFLENHDIVKRQSSTAFNSSFKEANELAERYTHTLNANKFLGDTYRHGWGHYIDVDEEALEYFKRSAESDDIYSQLKIAEIYEGRDNTQEALKWYQKLSDGGNAQAAEKVQELKAKMNPPKPPAPRQQEITPPQEDTSTHSAMVLEWYEWGCDFLDSKNYSDALKYFRLAANENYAPAQDKLGWMYQNGWGVRQDYSQAVSWFRRAAEQGNTEALASMGLMYYRGWGVPQDYDTSLEWYGKAAAQGSEVAQRRINSIQLLKANKAKIAEIERGTGYPIAGTIFAETLSVKQSPNTNSKRVKTLRTGHPVSVSKTTESDNDYWLYVRTASGTEGWVLGGYVKLINRNLSYEETNNRRRSLPKSGYVATHNDFLNLRNIPAVKGSQVIEKLDSGTSFTAYEVFAGDTVDWYRIITSYGDEGWVSGRYIELR